MEIIGIGTAAIDIVHEVATYPKEDSKVRSLGAYKCRGGNVTSAQVICSQFGGRCRWLGISTDPEKDSDAKFIHADLAEFNVDSSLAVIEKEGSMPVSYIISSQATGSRTIVHSRTIPELTCDAFVDQIERYMTNTRQDQNAPVWFHFEGRNMDNVRQMMLYVRESLPHAKISIEIEFSRYPWSLAKTLASLADYVFLSKDYLRDNLSISNAPEFFTQIQMGQWNENWNEWVKAFVCPWGAEGVYYLEMADGTIHHMSTAQLDYVVESNGAGDSFIGAALAGLSCGSASFHLVMKTACEVATFKCSQRGLKIPLDELTKWRSILQHSKDELIFRASEDRNTDAYTHSVTSEVVLELNRVEDGNQTDMDRAQVLIVPLLPSFTVDTDGDLVVPRRRVKKRKQTASVLESLAYAGKKRALQSMDLARGSETVFVLSSSSRTTWNTAGTQLWRAAFLLADYIYSAPDIFKGQTVLELGCGIGFTSLVASRFSRCVYATDSETDALFLAKKNYERNCCGNMQLRLLDWKDRHLFENTSATCFGWSASDSAQLKDLTILIASDVFYDDTTTIVFLRALRRLMLLHSRAKAYVASERRPVFSATAMCVVSLGFDTFQDHRCLHNASECHVRVSENQVQCQLCTSNGDILRFVVNEIKTSTFPQRFKYERLATLKLWRIEAVIVQ